MFILLEEVSWRQTSRALWLREGALHRSEVYLTGVGTQEFLVIKIYI
jgi:hypothetical protein